MDSGLSDFNTISGKVASLSSLTQQKECRSVCWSIRTTEKSCRTIYVIFSMEKYQY